MHVAENRLDVGTMLRVFELNVKNPAFAKQKNSLNAKGFLWKTILRNRISLIQNLVNYANVRKAADREWDAVAAVLVQ